MIPRLPSGFTHPLLIGEGAFSSVYRVRQTSLDRWVAIKKISETDPVRRKKLLSEAKTQANIHLDCIPQVYDAFEWKNRICIIMQWLKGVSLLTVLNSNPPPGHRYRIACALISAIANLHRLGFAHRDLKPENIIISPDNGVLLVDFGFTKNIYDKMKSINGTVKGTPAYMAPELWNAETTTINHLRADLFSLGKILKELLSYEDALQKSIDILLNILPQQRPESACEFQDIWNSTPFDGSESYSWHQICGHLTYSSHSRKLLTASKDLLYAHRHEESYWLLVECLEEDPDYDEAIKFMRAFPHSSKQKYRRNIYAVAISILIIILSSTTFLIGKYSKNGFTETETQSHSRPENSAQLIILQNKKQVSHSTRLLEDTLKAVSLSGRIVIQNFPQEGFLSIDSTLIYNKDNYKTGIVCHHGLHLLSWKDGKGATVWREKLFILPFQTKQISVKKGT